MFAKKSHNAINIITLVSVIGVAVGTMALVVVLSVFNGFEKLILSLFNAFNPDMEIRLKEGKVFSVEDLPLEELRNIPGIALYSEMLEETALITYRDKQHLVTMRGVSDDYIKITGLDTMLVAGQLVLEDGDADYLILGQGVEYVLAANLNDFLNPLNLYVPRRGRSTGLQPSQAFNASSNYASGVFGIQSEFDMEYILVPIRLARRLLNYENQATSLVIGLEPGANTSRVQKELENLLGNDFQIRNRLQQQDFLYKVMRSEKWAIFLILSFILIIATFNVIGSLTMLIIEKQRDIRILHNMGAPQKTIRQIFLTEGVLITLGGALAGILFGGIISWLQMRFGIISIQAEGNFIIDAYPVHIKAIDFLLVAITVFGIGWLSSLLPVRNISLLLEKKI
ncbi:MAG: ABC transporter permease [Bacteroidales bacterium]|nr:ABC transporter permease [Bacteroidales bacterium]NLM92607.1 ABC transporter permease [Bacteroidales bacterium]